MTMSNLPQPPQPGPVADGQICDPDNISSGDEATASAHQLVCQLTDVTETVMMPAQFQNALKGDVILAPGGTSIISALFRALTPEQYHSHSGIMSKNFVEITHCTAAESRLADYTQGVAGTGGIDPDVLTYLWPGSVTQTIDAAVNGETWIDPNGKSYTIQGFDAEAIGNTDNGRFVLTPPVVVKPDPESEATRTKLQAAAEYARSLGGQIDSGGHITVKPKAHYRFYCYTKPEIALTETAPASAGWAAGTFPAVCASFVWYCMRKNGVHFDTTSAYTKQTDLPATAVHQGALVGPETLDGLFFYPQAERLAGGIVLNGIFQQMVLDAEGVWSIFNNNLFPDWASDIADQILNTFAFDNAANGWGSNAWLTPGTGNAVSPDNIEWWRGPPIGVLGYAETLQYLDAHPEQYTVSRWKEVITYGSISGKVTVDGAPADKCDVSIYDGKDGTTSTDSSGAYKLEHVGVGSYNITASMVYKGYEYSVTKKVTLTAADANIKVDLVLKPPSSEFRRLEILYTWIGAEANAWGQSQMSIGPDQQAIPLSPGQLSNSLSIGCDDPGKYNVVYNFTAYLLEDLSVQVTLQASLYDNDDQSNLETGCGPYSYNVPMDDTAGAWVDLNYSSDGGWAAASRLSFTLKNSQDG